VDRDALILVVHLIAKGASLSHHIEYHSHVIDTMILNKFDQCRCEPVSRTRVETLRVDQRPADENEMGAVCERHRIQEIQGLLLGVASNFRHLGNGVTSASE